MRSTRARLALILLAGLGLRLLFLRVHQTIERDGVLYASVAEHLARAGRLIDLRERYHTFYPPGYPALIAPVYLLVGDSHRAGQIVSLTAGLALIVLVGLIGRRVGGERVGLLGAGLTAIYPPFVHGAVAVLTESTGAALLCLLVLLELRLAGRPGRAGSALAGLLVGGMYLVRPEGLLLSAGFAGLVVVWLARREPAARVGPWVLAFALALLLTVVPYVLYLHAVTGSWRLSGKGLAYWIGEAPSQFDAIAFGPQQPRPWRGLAVEAAAFAERYLRNFFRQEGVIAEAMSLLALGLAALGLAAARWRSRVAEEVVLLSAFVPLLLYPAFEVVERWTEPYMAILFVFVARGIAWVADQAEAPARSRLVAWGLLGLLALRYGPQLAIPLRYTPSFELVEQRDAGRWVRDQFGAGTSVMSRIPDIAYYARARWVALPYADIPSVIGVARREGVTLVVLDELTTRRLRPELLPLLEGPAPPGLTLVHQTDEFPGRRVRVFRVGAP
jgi:4-amino-4-deoxy-L-arabinose transferase-like glycosyltransferase